MYSDDDDAGLEPEARKAARIERLVLPTEEQAKEAIERIEERLTVARKALAEAEAIAKETGVGFSFGLGGLRTGFYQCYETNYYPQPLDPEDLRYMDAEEIPERGDLTWSWWRPSRDC